MTVKFIEGMFSRTPASIRLIHEYWTDQNETVFRGYQREIAVSMRKKVAYRRLS